MPFTDRYTGPWTAQQTRHLLRRTTFGPSEAMIEQALSLGLDGTLDLLFAERPLPDPPVKAIPDGSTMNSLDDPAARYGEPWIDGDPFPNLNPPMLRNRVLRARSKSLYAWTVLQMHASGISLVEKMAAFWHNHFVVGGSVIPHREYIYYTLLRRHALGNFRELTKEITVDTNMLLYLSGAENTARAPNENYSRELLELFTIGKGPAAGPGDYTNYTEEDVVAMARALTGWRVSPVSSSDTLTASFSEARHTSGPKQLSHRFDNRVIEENGADEYGDLIDVIFEQAECSRFISRKLYRWFVGSAIDAAVETTVIEPMAEAIRNADYDVAPALRTLFSSTAFFDVEPCMVRSPIDLVMAASRGLGIEPPTGEIEEEYDHAYNLYVMAADLEQAFFQHPNVAGWKAWYQEPQLDRLWINNLLLPKRHEFCRLHVEGGRFSYNDENYTISETAPVLDIVATVIEGDDPTILIRTLGERLYNRTLGEERIAQFKEVLIPGLPDYEWTTEYVGYLDDPTNDALRTSVENKLRALLGVMVRASEFQIM